MDEPKNSIKNNILLKENVHFRDEKKWKSRICVIRKVNENEEDNALVIELYKKIKNNEIIDNSCMKHNLEIKKELIYKEKYSIQLRTRIEIDSKTYLGLKFITNKYSIRNSNILTILTKSGIFTFSLLTSNSFTYWYHTITDNMGSEFQFEGFLIENSTSLSGNKVMPQTQSIILHIREQNLCLTSNKKAPLQILKIWDIDDVTQFRAIDNKFIFETINSVTNSKSFYVIISNYSNEMNFRLNYVLREKARKSRKSFMKPINDAVVNDVVYNTKQQDNQINEDEWDYENPYEHKLRFHSMSSNYDNYKRNKDDVFQNNTESYLSLNNRNIIKSKSSFQNSSLSFTSNNEDVLSDYIDYIPDTVLKNHHKHKSQQQEKQQNNKQKLSVNSSNDNYQQLKLSYRSESLNSALSRLENEQHEFTDDYYDYQIPYSQRNGIKEIKFSPIVTISSENVLDDNKNKQKSNHLSLKRNNNTNNNINSRLKSEEKIFTSKSDLNMNNEINVASMNNYQIRLRNKGVNSRSNSRIINFLKNIPLSEISDDNCEIKSRQSLVNEFNNGENNNNNNSYNQDIQKYDINQCKICKRNLDVENQYDNNRGSKNNLTDENVGNNEKQREKPNSNNHTTLYDKINKRKTSVLQKLFEFPFRKSTKTNDKKPNEMMKVFNTKPSILTETNKNRKILNVNSNEAFISNKTNTFINSFDKNLKKNFKSMNDNLNNDESNNELLCKHCYQIKQINKRKLSIQENDAINNNNNNNNHNTAVRTKSTSSNSSSCSSSSVVTYANIEKIRKKINHSQNNLNNISKAHNYVKENDYTEIDVNASKALFDASRAHQLARVEQN